MSLNTNIVLDILGWKTQGLAVLEGLLIMLPGVGLYVDFVRKSSRTGAAITMKEAGENVMPKFFGETIAVNYSAILLNFAPWNRIIWF
jgi:hypothetical protein